MLVSRLQQESQFGLGRNRHVLTKMAFPGSGRQARGVRFLCDFVSSASSVRNKGPVQVLTGVSEPSAPVTNFCTISIFLKTIRQDDS